nr:MAG TPA: hypothetical protein [Caudoviricetes sp.]
MRIRMLCRLGYLTRYEKKIIMSKKLSREWYRCKYFQIKNIKSIREELFHYDGLVELSWYHKHKHQFCRLDLNNLDKYDDAYWIKHKNAIKGFIITWVRTNKDPNPIKIKQR